MTADLPLTRTDRWIAVVLGLVVTLVTGLASTRQGVHRDEAVYMDAGERYVTYVERALTGDLKAPLSSKAVAPYFSCGGACNSEHPPLMKALFGLSWRVLADIDGKHYPQLHPSFARPKGRPFTLGLLGEATAFRLPTFFCFGALAALVYLFFLDALARRDQDGRPTAEARLGALVAALLTAAQPRAFFHAQTAAFDLPAALLWFAGTYAYWRALSSTRPIRAAIGVGLLYGLFLATKLQSFFLPVALGAHHVWLWFWHRRRPGDGPMPKPWPLLAMATIGPLVLFLLWPYLWHDGIAHFKTYFAFHATHVHYNFEYLGQNYNRPPFPVHEPLGMLLTTAPVVLLALAALGVHRLAREKLADPRSTRFLLVVAALVPVGPFLTGTAPIFGETKHWLATMPILALCAGFAVQALAVGVQGEWPRLRRAALVLLFAFAVTPSLVETIRSHPYGLSHYNALAGGAPGGADLGMNRQFWGYSPRGLLAWMNETFPPMTRLYPHDMAAQSMRIYQRDGLLRDDIHDAGMELGGMRSSQYALVVHELHFNKYDYMIWNTYGHGQPIRVLTLDGVPLVSLYARKQP